MTEEETVNALALENAKMNNRLLLGCSLLLFGTGAAIVLRVVWWLTK